MDRSEIVSFFNTNPVFYLATVEGDKPHLRAIFLYKADDAGIVFHTGKFKELYKQLLENPHVEACFYDSGSNIQIRLTGMVESMEDLAMKKEIVENRQFLKPWIEKMGYDPLAVFRLKYDTATVWTMETNFEPKKYIKL